MKLSTFSLRDAQTCVRAGKQIHLLGPIKSCACFFNSIEGIVTVSVSLLPPLPPHVLEGYVMPIMVVFKYILDEKARFARDHAARG